MRNLLRTHDFAVIGFMTSNAPRSAEKHGMNNNPCIKATIMTNYVKFNTDTQHTGFNIPRKNTQQCFDAVGWASGRASDL